MLCQHLFLLLHHLHHLQLYQYMYKNPTYQPIFLKPFGEDFRTNLLVNQVYIYQMPTLTI
jgi:hypothetical protein